MQPPKVVSGGPILHNDTRSLAEKSKCSARKKNEICLINTWMNIFAERMRKRKSMKIFWVRKFYYENEKERGILETLLWMCTSSYNTTIAFLYIIPCYSQDLLQEQSYLYPSFYLTLFYVPYFDLNILAALCWVTIWLAKKSN